MKEKNLTLTLWFILRYYPDGSGEPEVVIADTPEQLACEIRKGENQQVRVWKISTDVTLSLDEEQYRCKVNALSTYLEIDLDKRGVGNAE